jgi:hypothetical protein
MNGIRKSLGIVLLIVMGAPLHAQVTYNFTHDVLAPGGMPTVPGQTVDYELVVANPTSSSPTFESYQAACGNYQASLGCTQSASTPVSASQAPTTPTGLPGWNYSYSLGSGGGSASFSVSVTGSTASPPTGLTGIGVTMGEFQQLNIAYTGGAPAPGTIGMDVTYNLSTGLTDNSVGSSGRTIGANSSLAIEDPATFNPTLDASGFPSIGFVMGATASQGNQFGTGAPASLNQTSPVTLSLNHPYWVELFLQGGAFLNPGSTDALSVNFSAMADPTFSVDPDWLKDNPQYTASDFTISQDFNPSPVPLPPTAWLMLGGLIGLGAVARTRRLL